MDQPAAGLKAHLNGQTARIDWQELQRHYARGAVVRVAAELDLIEVAIHFIQDDKAAVEQLRESGQLAAADDNDARDWHQSETELWAVVVAPWVLVQTVKT